MRVFCSRVWRYNIIAPWVSYSKRTRCSSLHVSTSLTDDKKPGLCETTEGVKSYSGYVHLPPDFLDGESQSYPINT